MAENLLRIPKKVPSRYRTKRSRRPELHLELTSSLYTGSSDMDLMSPLSSTSGDLLSPLSPTMAGPGSSITSPTANCSLISISLPTQTVVKNVDVNTTFETVLGQLVNEHRYELNPPSLEEHIIWEVRHSENLQRPIRNHEYLKFVLDSWQQSASGSNYFRVTSSSLRNDVNSLAFLNPRRDYLDLPNGPEFSGQVWMIKKNKSWRKCWIQIRNRSLSIYSSNPSTSSSSKPDKRLSQIDHFEIYEPIKHDHTSHNQGRYQFSICSQDNLDFFLDKTDASYTFSTNSTSDYHILRNIFYTVRSQFVNIGSRSHHDLLENHCQRSTSHLINAPNLLNIHSIPPNVRSLDHLPMDPLGTFDNLKIGSITGDSPSPSTSPILKDSLLGASYDLKKGSLKTQRSLDISARKLPEQSQVPFAPNSLLAKSLESSLLPTKPVNLSASACPNPDLASLMSSKGRTLPTHSIAVGHEMIKPNSLMGISLMARAK